MSGWVQNLGSVGSSGSTTTLVLTIGTITTVPVGDYIFVAAQGNASATWSMADSRGNTYTLDKQETTAAPFTGIFRAQVAAGKQLVTGDTITFTTTSQGGRGLVAAQYTGLVSGTLDKSNVNNATTVSTLAVTDASPNATPDCLVVAAFGIIATTSAQSCATGYTLRPKAISTGTIHETWLADKVVSATETSSATMSWTTAGSAGGAVATYASTPSGGAPSLRELMLAGVGT